LLELHGRDGVNPAGREQVTSESDVDNAVGLRGRLLEPVEMVTSCPAATSSGMTYEPAWPVPPVTKTCMGCPPES
jgi:hypothetical protein